MADEILADIRSAAWLVAETSGDSDIHRRHELEDICEKDNIDAVWRTLANADADVRFALQKILIGELSHFSADTLLSPDAWIFRFRMPLMDNSADFIREKTHGYMVAKVMAERTAILIPAAAGYWEGVASDSLAALSGVAGSMVASGRASRPLWPL